jgi:class I fructose-bisphosphate aldolase
VRLRRTADRHLLLGEIRAIHSGGGFSSILGRNSFQRPKSQALKMIGEVMDIYAGTRA